IEGEGQVVFRYVDESGQPVEAGNPNGSLSNIAGIINREGNVLGLMPHPERASEEALGSADGRGIFTSLAGALARLAKASSMIATSSHGRSTRSLPLAALIAGQPRISAASGSERVEVDGN